ncbi:MAG: formylglycine-generating enzyme family protein [Kouleothrix sp.]|nr:formylglycine-generating enzyme family protein [Kouleothrix sp.]
MADKNDDVLLEKQITHAYKPPRDGFEWVRVPAGTFAMGSDTEKDPKAQNIETPQHNVFLPEFWISRFPVTNSHYKQFVEDTGYLTPKHWENGDIQKGKELHPVVYVSWRDMQLFCEWAYVRSPTEAEWEKAARGVEGRIYPWGDTAPHGSLCNFASVDGTTPVGIFRQGVSPFGVFDMAGNVWEWTSTLWGQFTNKSDFPYPYNANDGREDLNAPDNFARMIRGGGYSYYAHRIRCAVRWYAHPGHSDDVGFRVVRRN